MKALARPDRPREKLLESGPASLGANELLALVLGSGTRSSSALELANQVLAHAGGLDGLAGLEPCDLVGVRGLKDARAARIVAALELGRRATSPPSWPRPRFRLPGEAARYLIPRFGTKPLEEFGILVLDTRNGLKRLHMVSSGSLNGSLVHPREVFREAAVSRAAAIIAFHNHPSGDPAPSREDHDLTRRLRQAGKILGIELLDHVVVAAGRYWSFKEHGEI
ncbi:MAG TPA: DNA repair protein RadC [Vicinamibacteria bacterium]|nr:DNA repair protein RadC [Vicinamibacteria bacterium]